VNGDDLVRDTYAHFGLAIFKAQVLEHGVVNAMIVARMPDRDRINRRDIDAFMDRQFEHTLGQLLRELKKYTSVPDDLSQILAGALSTRNWLAHDYFRERAADFVTDAGCHRMIAELEAAQRAFDLADERLSALVRPIRERFGVTDAAIASEVRKLSDGSSGLDG
jgi:hypothetical protein